VCSSSPPPCPPRQLLWEKLRLKATPLPEKQEKIGKFLQLMKGKLVDVTGRHDASRVVQWCVRHGTPDQRAFVMAELTPSILELCTARHGHQLVRFCVHEVGGGVMTTSWPALLVARVNGLAA
jgi:hypothetical protein